MLPDDHEHTVAVLSHLQKDEVPAHSALLMSMWHTGEAR